ncbi:MAG: YciI family protein [Planctomycetales bacterium]|nr:YciI family protein [Planctomycetales bacterium]
MKYILLIYSKEDAWHADELDAARDESVRVCHELNAKGQYLNAAPLHPASTATCVRVRDGNRTVSDGPYAETKEQLAGYFLIDVDNLDDAIEIASQIPGTRRGTTEIRPIVELPGLPGTIQQTNGE